jgi:hypothetical protein
MTQTRQRANLAIALLLVFSLSQVYVQANLATKSFAAKAEAATLARTGKLITSGNNPISLNGNRTLSGTTVLSGSELQTPAGVEASVRLGQGSLLSLAPQTSLTLNFDDASIDVTVTSGHATLTTGPGMKGAINTPDGRTERTDSAEFLTTEDPAASTVDGGDNLLFAAAVGQGQSEREKKQAMAACLRAAEADYRAAIKPAQDAMKDAQAKAEADYHTALRNSRGDRAAQQVARQAKQRALREAQAAYRAATMAANAARKEAIRQCKRPSKPPTTSSEKPQPPGGKGEGLPSSGGNGSARGLGLGVIAAAVTTAVLIVVLNDDGRGSTVSAVKP